MTFKIDRPLPTTVRYSNRELRIIERFMETRNIKKLGTGLRIMIRFAGVTNEILLKSDYKYETPPTDLEIETYINNLTAESKKKLADSLIEELGPEYVKGLRQMNNEDRIVDKDIEGV